MATPAPRSTADAAPETDDRPERRYVRIRPTDDALSAAAIASHVRRLYGLASPPPPAGWRGRLGRRPPPRTVECLLVSDGDGGVTYALGIDDPALGDSLERLLRGLFPDTYELEATTADPLADLPDDATPTAVEFVGVCDRPRDWQTRLVPFETFLADDRARVPLAAVIEAMAEAPCPVVYQALLTPKPDWSGAAVDRRAAIEANHDTIVGQVENIVAGVPEDKTAMRTDPDDARIESIRERDAGCSFDVNARIVVLDDAEGPSVFAVELASALSTVGGRFYGVEGRVQTNKRADRVLEAIAERTAFPPSYRRLANRLPWSKATSRGLVVDVSEAPDFFVVGGPSLTTAGARAVAPTPTERTALPRPPFDQLAAYREPGFTLGLPLTADGERDTHPIAVPPDLQPLHSVLLGATGSGKTTLGLGGLLDVHAATDGATVLIDPKGDGLAGAYLHAHYARFGSLDDVLYFDCAEVLPAFGFFDVRADLAAGVPRETAVGDRVGHFTEILRQIVGADLYDRAIRSRDVIEYVPTALFDPINGDDAFSFRDLHATVRLMHERQTPPAVADPDLEEALAGIVANRARTFDEIMAGVANRIEKISIDPRLAAIFNHVPEDGDPHLDLGDFLDEDVVIVIDTGGLRPEAQRVLTLVVLSNLWSALRRRTRLAPDADHALVTLHLEEAASVAVSGLLKTFLAQARGFDCAVSLSMQFPGQLRDGTSTTYHELLNNAGTIVTGKVTADRGLAERLATDDMDATRVGNRLRALRRGQWLVRLPARFDEPEPRPFLVASLPPPPGHPEGDRPLVGAAADAYETELEALVERTTAERGIRLVEPGRADEAAVETEALLPRVDSALPYTKRLPTCMWYDAEAHSLRCLTCDTRYDAVFEGLIDAIECCSSLERTNRDDIPISHVGLNLSEDERRERDATDRQLVFLKAVLNAADLRYDPLEYDLLRDSMLRLQEYVGIEPEAVTDLIERGLLVKDADRPHRLYTVTPEGRALIGERFREGVDFGHGEGDLGESSTHVFGVEVGRRYCVQTYVDDPTHPGEAVIPYYQLDDGRRLDVAVVDAAGEIVVAVEVERINHDAPEAVVSDYDKMADCGVDEAIWVVVNREDAHTILDLLADPPDNEPRVEAVYSENTPPEQFSIEAPGLTQMATVVHLRDQLSDLG